MPAIISAPVNPGDDVLAGNINDIRSDLLTNHDHDGSSTGAKVDHVNLNSIGTKTHAQIDTHINANTNVHGIPVAYNAKITGTIGDARQANSNEGTPFTLYTSPVYAMCTGSGWTRQGSPTTITLASLGLPDALEYHVFLQPTQGGISWMYPSLTQSAFTVNCWHGGNENTPISFNFILFFPMTGS